MYQPKVELLTIRSVVKLVGQERQPSNTSTSNAAS